MSAAGRRLPLVFTCLALTLVATMTAKAGGWTSRVLTAELARGPPGTSAAASTAPATGRKRARVLTKSAAQGSRAQRLRPGPISGTDGRDFLVTPEAAVATA